VDVSAILLTHGAGISRFRGAHCMADPQVDVRLPTRVCPESNREAPWRGYVARLPIIRCSLLVHTDEKSATLTAAHRDQSLRMQAYIPIANFTSLNRQAVADGLRLYNHISKLVPTSQIVEKGGMFLLYI
jgi:hypothetical protein